MKTSYSRKDFTIFAKLIAAKIMQVQKFFAKTSGKVQCYAIAIILYFHGYFRLLAKLKPMV